MAKNRLPSEMILGAGVLLMGWTGERAGERVGKARRRSAKVADRGSLVEIFLTLRASLSFESVLA